MCVSYFQLCLFIFNFRESGLLRMRNGPKHGHTRSERRDREQAHTPIFLARRGAYCGIHTLRTITIYMTYVENVHTSLHTRVTTSWARCVGGTRHSSGRNALTDRWQTGLLQAPAQGGACLSRGRCPAPSSTTPRTMRRSPRPPVPRPGPGSVVGVRAGVGISVRRELVAALAFGSP